ncbi:hypothetical protein ACFQO1_00455 [Jejudonia soesokkakensis]|uniref:Glycosyltransferase RgtA/B/C/D-like domain-containing protein n=1 Tax=Jejudonia soesokkakensis TaxID=1323432 RepID=A0ABW2MPS6_9FLAO
MTFAILDRLSPLENEQNLKIFELITAILTALAFSLFLLWCKRRYGILAAFIALFLLLISQWTTFFGRNLWWVLWSFYIPFLSLLWLFEKESKNKNLKLTFIKIAVVCFITVLLKCFYTGFEYITTALIMLAIPLVFYALLDKWKVKTFLKRFLVVVVSALTALLASMAILIWQISMTKGSIEAGINHIILSYTKRASGGGNADIPEIYKESINASLSEVLQTYWNGTAINLNNWQLAGWDNLWNIEFGELLLLLLLCSALIFISKSISPTTFKNYKKNKTLIITMWISISAPLSWLVVFKGHSYIHTHMNFIIWYMPFGLFGYAGIGSVMSSLVKDIRLYLRTSVKSYKRYVLIALSVLIIGILFTKINFSSKDYAVYKKITAKENLVSKQKRFSIYHLNNEIYYVNENPTYEEESDIIFLHVYPKDSQDLTPERAQFNFENLDLKRSEYEILDVPFWVSTSSVLLAHKKLPDFEIQEIVTGQYDEFSRLWSVRVEWGKRNQKGDN